MNAFDRAGVDALGFFSANARFCDYVSHYCCPSLNLSFLSLCGSLIR